MRLVQLGVIFSLALSLAGCTAGFEAKTGERRRLQQLSKYFLNGLRFQSGADDSMASSQFSLAFDAVPQSIR